MSDNSEDTYKGKISREFAARLVRLDPLQKVRAIVMLHSKGVPDSARRDRSHKNRQATVDAFRNSAEQALFSVDNILKRFDGKRLGSVNALGSIPVETTPAGIKALASSSHVKAILDDQRISLLAGRG